MSMFSDLFNPAGAAESGVKVNTDVYKVSWKDGKSGVYSSVVRFVPYFANPSKCVMTKRVSYVKNPITQRGMYVDDPRTVGQYSPVTDMFFKLKNTGVKAYEDFGKQYLSSKEQYASLVQILKDDQHPDLVGKIKVFVYGKKLYDKLHNEQVLPGGAEGINPFQPIFGRHFSIQCSAQGEWNDFSNSYFFDDRNNGQLIPPGIWVLNESTGQYEIATENMDQNHIIEFLHKNSPDLSVYDYHEWTEEQTKFVNEVLAIAQNYLNTGQLAAVQTAAPAQTFGQPVQPAVSNVVAPQPVVNNAPVFPGAVPPAPQSTQPVNPTPQFSAAATGPINFGGTPAPATQGAAVVGAQAPVVAPPVAPTAAPKTTGINMDDILNQI